MGIITTSRSTTEYSRCVPYEPTLWRTHRAWGTANPNLITLLWRTHPRGAPQIRTLPWWPTLVGHRKYEYEKNTASQKKIACQSVTQNTQRTVHGIIID